MPGGTVTKEDMEKAVAKMPKTRRRLFPTYAGIKRVFDGVCAGEIRGFSAMVAALMKESEV